MNKTREIKFRAWCRDEMCYGIEDVISGCLNDYDCLMQFTGLKDKNGKEIYEGDFLLHHHKYADCREGPVEWGTIIGEEENGVGFTIEPECVNDAVVIGNIYENGDLLNGKQ